MGIMDALRFYVVWFSAAKAKVHQQAADAACT
jgi:hypothetical protein